MKQLTLPSWQLEKTWKGFVESRLAKEQSTTNSDKWAVLLLASDAIKKTWPEPNQNARDVFKSWIDEMHPENKETLDDIFSNNQRYRNVVRLASASVRPAGIYETAQLLSGIESGQIEISLRTDENRE